MITEPNNAGGSADDVYDVAEPDSSSDSIPMRVKGADRDRNPGPQAEFFRPFGAQRSCYRIGGKVSATQFVAYAGQERVHGGQELF